MNILAAAIITTVLGILALLISLLYAAVAKLIDRLNTTDQIVTGIARSQNLWLDVRECPECGAIYPARIFRLMGVVTARCVKCHRDLPIDECACGRCIAFESGSIWHPALEVEPCVNQGADTTDEHRSTAN